MTLQEYVLTVLGSFERDPPDSDTQRGYLEAIIETGKVFNLDLSWDRWDALASAEPAEPVRQRPHLRLVTTEPTNGDAE